MSENDLTASRVRSLLEYDHDTGVFRWRVGRQGTHGVGAVAGGVRPSGYITTHVDGIDCYSHRLVWLYVHGSWPDGLIDHINGVRTDNRICNLRVVSPLEQMRNRKLNTNNKTGFCGVYWSERDGKYVAHIKVKGKKIYLGYFRTLKEAAGARKAAEIEHGFHPNHGLTAAQRARVFK